jgi:polysaccharide pyruvyl transferase WcaK-like protein
MKILLTNMCDDGNRGDLAILQGTVRAFKASLPDLEFSISPMEVSAPELLTGPVMKESAKLADFPLVPSPVPAKGVNSMKLAPWVERTSRALLSGGTRSRALGDADREYARAVRSADLVVAKGGQYLYSYPGPRQALFAVRMLHQLNAAQRIGTPTCVFGTSLGPWQPAIRGRFKSVLSRCAAVVTREELSYEFAVRNGLGNAQRGVDLAFALYDGGAESAATREGIAFTPRDIPQASDVARKRYEEVLVRTAQWLIDERGEHCYLAVQVIGDLPLCERLYRAIDRPGRVEIASEINDYPMDQLIDWYGARKLIVATRLHSVILAALRHTPSVILECSPPKMEGISKQLKTAEWRVPAATDEVKRLPVLVSRALDSLDELRRALPDAVAPLQAQAFSSAAKLLEQTGMLSR